MRKGMRATAIWAGLLLCGIAYLLTSFHVVTDISEFLPNDASNQQQRVVREVATGKLARQMVLTIEVPDTVVAAEVSIAFEAALRAKDAWLDEIAQLDAGTSDSAEDAIWALYQDRWPYFFARDAEAAQRRLQDPSLQAAATHLRGQLQGPMGMFITRIAPADPFLVLPSLFEQIEGAQAGAVTQENGRLVTDDGRFIVVFLTTHSSAFENDIQRPVLQGIEEAFQSVSSSYDQQLTLEMSGVNRISIAAQDIIERDIRRISILSTLLIFTLLLLVFGGIRVAFLVLASIATGVIMALCACHLLFGRVHGISLAFGAALIGLAVDYMIHLYSHHAEADGQRSPQQSVRRVLPALLIAATSTLTGFFALGFTGFPGLREVSVFAVAGLGSALATVCLVTVHWMPERIRPTRIRTLLGDGLLAGFHWVRATRWPAGVVLLAFAVVIGLGLPTIRWSAQIADSGQFDEALVAEEERVRARVSRFDQSRLIASTGADAESALRSAERVADLLESSSLVGGFASITHLLPSVQRQLEVAEVLQGASDLKSRFEAIFEEAGFRPEMFRAFYDVLDGELPPPLDLPMLEASPLAGLVEAFSAPTSDGYVVLTPVRDVRDTEALRAGVDAIEGSVFIDERDVMGDVGGGQRLRIVLVVSLGLLAVCLLLWWRYRRLRTVFSALLPSIVSVLWTWSMLALMGIELDLILVAFSLLIISLGVDYGVFLIDTSHEGGPELRAALIGVITAAATTLIGFGLLATSEFSMLHRVGLVALLGVSAAMVLSPVALVLAMDKEV